MNYLQLKNYRSIENAEFLLGIENYFIGDNNTGKSCLLRLIETIFKNTKLNFEGTYLAEIAINDLKYDDAIETIDICYGSNHESFLDLHDNKVSKVKLLFEYLEIGSLAGYEYPLIKKLATCFNEEENIICLFEINYKLVDNQLMIESIIIKKCENSITKDLTKYTKNLNLIEQLKELFLKQQLNKQEIQFDDKGKSKKASIDLSDGLGLDFILDPALKFNIDSLYDFYYFSNLHDSNQKNHLKMHFFNSWRRLNQNKYSKYLNPLQSTFKEFYTLNQTEFGKVDSLISYKNKNEFIIERINDFFKKSNMVQSIIIDSKEVWNTKLYFPVYKKNDKKMKLSMSGSGLSQVLPILFSIYNWKSYKLFIEQPEVHLHPRAQSLLGELFADYYFEYAKSNQKLVFTNQLFIETHSMYLLDRLRYKISQEDKVDENNETEQLDISLFFLENTENKVEIETLKILSNGKYKGNVDKFLKYFIDELVESFTV